MSERDPRDAPAGNEPERAQRDQGLAIALLILGGLIFLVKLVGWAALRSVIMLWPIALIVIGWQMCRRADREERGR